MDLRGFGEMQRCQPDGKGEVNSQPQQTLLAGELSIGLRYFHRKNTNNNIYYFDTKIINQS